MERVGWTELERKTERVNELLERQMLKPSTRYGYVAIDVCDREGRVCETLLAGLTRREALDFLDALERVLLREGRAFRV